MTVPFWSAVQAIVWIATRDANEVSRVQVAASDVMPIWPSEPLSDLSLDSVERRLILEANIKLRGERGYVPDLTRATQEFVSACAVGDLTLTGRLRGAGTSVGVAQHAWAHLEIRDHADHGVVAASPDRFDHVAEWWDVLRVESAAVLRRWPSPPAQDYLLLSFHERQARESAIDVARRNRLLRKYRSVQSAAIELSPDGLPHGPDTTLVEALSWLTLGKAVPASVWLHASHVNDAINDVRMARTSVAFSWRTFRKAARTYPDAANREDIWSEAGIAYGAAASHLKDGLDRLKVANEGLIQKLGAAHALEKLFEATARDTTGDTQKIVQGIADQQEERLFDWLRRGHLECYGRKSEDEVYWVAMDPDNFRHPVSIRWQHNILEPASSASTAEVTLIRNHISTWVSLRVDTDAFRAIVSEVQVPGQKGTKRRPVSQRALSAAFANYCKHIEAGGGRLAEVLTHKAMQEFFDKSVPPQHVSRERVRELLRGTAEELRYVRGRPGARKIAEK